MDWLEFKEFLKDTFKYIVFIVAILFLAVYVLGIQQIIGPSMNDTLDDKDIVLLNKFKYFFSNPDRFDIISFYNDESKYLVKRVIGLPGETVEFINNKLYINNEIIEEDYLNGSVLEDFKLSDIGYNVIPEGMYFVLGDNRDNSLDSRDSSIGLVKKENIIGQTNFRIWPLNNLGVVK